MADNKLTLPKSQPAESSTITCNLHNPTRAQRIIYDGIQGSQRQIVVEGGDTKKNVTLHRMIADELRARNKVEHNSDLRVLPLTEDTEAA